MNYFDKLWKDSYPATIGELQGTFEVKILSGWFRPMGAMYSIWQKMIENEKGCNMQDNEISGHFLLSYSEWDKKDNFYICFDYNQPQNTGLWLRLQDHVRQISKNYFIGKIYLKIWGKYRFMGYFSLLRIEIEEIEETNKENI